MTGSRATRCSRTILIWITCDRIAASLRFCRSRSSSGNITRPFCNGCAEGDKVGCSPQHPFIGRHARPTPPRHTRYELQRSEEHTSELQSRFDLVCRLLLEKKKN